MQSFMGIINFVRRLVLDFPQIVKPLEKMVKKSVQFKWNDIEKVSFKDINTKISRAPFLRSPNFKKNFIVYTFPLNNSLATVLTQKGELGDKYLISFMSIGLEGAN